VELNVAGVERHLDPQLFYRLRDFEQHRGKHVVVLGGGNSTLDWVLNLVGVAESVTRLHRSDKFKAAPASAIIPTVWTGDIGSRCARTWVTPHR